MEIIRKAVASLMTAGLCLTLSALAQSKAEDKTFVQKAAEGNKAEIELGKMAQEKASNDAVKKFGERMFNDHTQALENLRKIAYKEHVAVPDKVNAEDQAIKDRLWKLSGKEFDQAYMQEMVKDHTEDVSEFQTEAQSGTDPDVKNYAQSTLPTLQDHLKQATQIANSGNLSAAQQPSAPAYSQTELRNFDQFLDTHQAIKAELTQNPSLVNDPNYLRQHPQLAEFLQTHPGVQASLRQNPSAFIHSENAYGANEDRETALRNFHQFLVSHPTIRTELVQNPALAKDPNYLTQHPRLAEFLQSHGGVRAEMETNPSGFMQSEAALR